jgi:hypothetical protein
MSKNRLSPVPIISGGVAGWQSTGRRKCKSRQIKALGTPEYFANGDEVEG